MGSDRPRDREWRPDSTMLADPRVPRCRGDGVAWIGPRRDKSVPMVGVSIRPVTKSAFSEQSPNMERPPDDHPQQYDRGSDLNPDHPAQLPQHYLQPRAPRLWHLISEGLDRMGHEPQRIPYPARFVDETREDQRPSGKNRQKAKRLRSGQLADGGAGGCPNGQHPVSRWF